MLTQSDVHVIVEQVAIHVSSKNENDARWRRGGETRKLSVGPIDHSNIIYMRWLTFTDNLIIPW